MQFFILILLTVGFTMELKAQAAGVSSTVVNEVLFELDGVVWTQSDFKLFLQAKTNKEFSKLNELNKSDEQLFLISRMFFEQSADLGMISKDKTTNLNNNLENEVERLHSVIDFLDIKDKQLADGQKSKLWLSFLAKKYKFSAHVARYKDLL